MNEPSPVPDVVPSAGLEALIRRAERAGRSAPPVELWNPPFCGDIDMEIRADGSWHYCGSPINREALVRLFASVLRADADGRFYLVTPVEKLGIRVVDAPFLAVEMSRNAGPVGPVLTFRTNVGDVATADAAHPLRLAAAGGETGFEPYLLIRGRLEAKLTRALAFDLAELVEEDEAGLFVCSAGARFPFGAMA